jgi:hypothetical protein
LRLERDIGRFRSRIAPTMQSEASVRGPVLFTLGTSSGVLTARSVHVDWVLVWDSPEKLLLDAGRV